MYIFILLCINVVSGGVVNVRLTDGSKPYEGNLQVLYNGTTWKYVCDHNWDIRDAKVVCKELGFDKARIATSNSFFQGVTDEFSESTEYWLSNVQCTGDEREIRNCDMGYYEKIKCLPGLDTAGVICEIESSSNIVRTKPQPSPASGGDVEVRLVGHSRHGFVSNGYLEVSYQGIWGAVCAESWSHLESFVACGNLGYPDYERTGLEEALIELEAVAAKTGLPFLMKNVRCLGTESKLSECDHDGWRRHVCRIPVYLNCKRSPFLMDNRFDKSLISDHNVRIRAGYRHSEGRAEVYHNGEWGSICHDNWSIQNANIFCRQLGFGTAYEATHNSSFGQGSGKVWLDEVKCKGDEPEIETCMSSHWGESDCGHKSDAGVKCHYPYGKPEGKVKLSGHRSPLEGQVKIMLDGQWKGICGIGWGLREASVICRQLGLGFPKRALSTKRYGYEKEFGMFNVKCSGDELSIHHCRFDRSDVGQCRYYDIASVECTRSAPDLVMDVQELRDTIRLDVKSLESLSCAFEEKCLASDADFKMNWPSMYNRTLLRFSARFWNRGTTAFRPNIRKSDWEYHECHDHYHSMERFADYDLTDSIGRTVGEGHKASFCLEDFECEKGVKKLYDCKKKGDQGVSVNCADTYQEHLDCQWIDITGLKSGKYTLRVVLNPQNLVYETDYSNNIASCELNYIDIDRIGVGNCKIDSCEQMSHGGKGGGACCKFPFTYKGEHYRACTTDGNRNGQLWCATTSNYDNDGLWGYCS